MYYTIIYHRIKNIHVLMTFKLCFVLKFSSYGMHDIIQTSHSIARINLRTWWLIYETYSL